MANNKPLSSEERLQIIEVLKRGNLSHRAIAQQFKRSQSTISAIARDAGISSTHRRKRTPAARELENSFTREERVNLTDRILGVIGEMVEGGGLNPRELRETTMALKQTLDARRAEDFLEQDDKGKSRGDDIYWEPSFSDANDPEIGLGFDPKTKIGREMIEVSKALDAGRDLYAERCAREKAQREAERAEQERRQDDDT